MRIADVSAFYTANGGGVRIYVERKLHYAEQQGVDLAVIVPGAVDRIEPRGCRTQLIHIASPKLILDRRYRYFAGAGAVHEILDRLRPDFVEASSPWRTASIVAGWRGRAPRALFMHADPLAAYAYRWFEGLMPREKIDRGFDWFWAHLRRAAAAYDLIVTPNDDLTARLRQGCIDRVATIPLGVDPGIFSPSRRDPTLRRALLRDCGLTGEANLLLGVGRYAPEKRWATVIDAAAHAGLERPIGLVLVGEGRGRSQLERHIGSNPHIRLHPPIRSRAALATLLASGDALIHGCEAETFGLVAAEAAASGLPLIVPDAGGAAGQARRGCSETYRAGDHAAAACAVDRLLARDQDQIRRDALRAAETARTMDRHFDDLFGRYETLVARRAMAA